MNLLYLVRTADTMDEVRSYALLAETELARVADISLQTLQFHRNQSTPAPVKLRDTISAVLRLYEARFHSRKVTPVVKLQHTPDAMLLEGDLRQVLNNLIRNAYDAMPAGGKLHVRLRPGRCLHTGIEGVRITVADTGTGFIPKMRKHLFEPFHTSKETIGTGLGLWISKGIIDKHRGRMHMRSRMEAESARGHGTIFSLWLPMHEGPVAAAA